ncbi:MAG: sialate O-acetylesterase [Spirochaetes bacterium]|nr:sialate O-acetylesterase [Spirochaetota bacterium]
MPLSLAPIFTHHAVLQRDRPIPVWGIAAPGSDVSVTLAGAVRLARAGADGRFRTEFSPLPAGGPHSLAAESKGERITFNNILIGEVWLASGQSNMQWNIADCAERAEALAEAERLPIRMDRGSGWRVCDVSSVVWFSAVGFFFARHLFNELKVPIGIIDRSAGGTRIEAWMSQSTLKISPFGREMLALADSPDVKAAALADDAAMRAWLAENPRVSPLPAATLGKWRLGRALPVTLYEKHIKPLAPYAVRGVIWYQGESNSSAVSDANGYRTLLPGLIGGWRGLWDERDMPFIYAQLPNYKGDEPDAWAITREAMRKALTVQNTAMAVTIDLGETNDIHPKRKKEVGRRLALGALAKAYAKDIIAMGPLYRGMKHEGRAVRLLFDHVGTGLDAKNPSGLTGFTIAGKDGKFRAAKAVIDKDAVLVKNDIGNDAVVIRYAWANDPAWCLVNSAGLPASPFTTAI